MPVYKLQYFDARAVAETARFIFAVGKQEYEDARFPISFGTPGDFSTIIRKEFDEAKASGELDPSAGKLPMLYVDGVKIGQSKAIERFLAKEFGLAGATAIEAAQIDAIVEMVRDIKDDYNGAKRGKKDDELAAAVKTFFDETLPTSVKKLEKMVPDQSAGDFLFGKISHADITVFQFLGAPEGGFFDNTAGALASFQECPKIKKAMEATAANTEVKAWMEKRPKTMF
jgi:glutathione S-transferase